MGIKQILTLLVACSLLFSCKKEKAYWDVDLYAPVAQTSLNLSSLFPDTLLESQADSSLEIVLQQDLFNFSADSLLKVPDTNIVNNFVFPVFGFITYNPNDLYDLSPSGSEITYDLQGVELHDAILRSGKILIHVESALRQPSIYTCKLPSATLNGLPLVMDIPITGGSILNPATKDTAIDVSGYQLNLTGINGNKVNTLVQYITLRIDPNANADTVFMGQFVNSVVNLKDIVPQYGHGYFGTQNINVGPDSAFFEIFNQIQSGTMDLDNAQVDLTIKNEFGVDLRGKINQLVSRNSKTGNSVSLTGSNINNYFNINRALATGNTTNPVIGSNKTLSINPGNSNILSFIGNLPNWLEYAMIANLNPLGNVSGTNDFAYYGTSLNAKMDVRIPLKFSASNLILLDTTEFSLGDFNEIDNINRGALILKASNTYPFELSLDALLLDENNTPLNYLLNAPNNKINAPVLDQNGKVIQASVSEIRIEISAEKIEALKKARKIAFSAKFSTAGQPNKTTFLDYYKLDLLLTADINYSTKQ